jgi:hypothetical protein
MELKQKIRAKDIVTSIVSGLTDQELTEKFRLTPRGLQIVFRKLFTLKLLDRSEFHHRLSASDVPEDNEIVRRFDRMEILLPLDIQDVDDPKTAGVLSNLTAQGVGTIGIIAQVGEGKHFKVLTDEYFQLAPFRFAARCRWAMTDEETGDLLAGFEITSISEREKAKLLNLIETLDYLYQKYE